MSLRKNRNQGAKVGSAGSSKSQNQNKRVEDIILSRNHRAYKTDEDLGKIFFTEIGFNQEVINTINLPSAKPLNRNNFTYPSIGDIVQIIEGPSPEYYSDIGGDISNKTTYYTPAIGIHNNTASNALPNQVKSKKRNPKRSSNVGNESNSEDLKLGTYFKENADLNPLTPGEGDSIMEGKNGQRVRFTTTGPSGTNAISNNVTDDPNDGNPSVGDKAMILSLGNGSQENVTEDAASIYMLENQSIPIDATSTNIDSLNSTYKPLPKPLEEISKSPAEAIPNPIPDQELVLEPISFTNLIPTVDEATTPPLPDEIPEDPDPVFAALNEAQEEGLLEVSMSIYDISIGEDIRKDLESTENDISYNGIEPNTISSEADYTEIQDQDIYTKVDAPLGNKGITLATVIKSSTAKEKKIANFPGADRADGRDYQAPSIMYNLDSLVLNCVDPLLSQYPNLKINSGLRVGALNTAVGGSPRSEHRIGRAVDIAVPGVPTYEIFNYIVSNNIPYNQLIWEFPEYNSGSWIHISYIGFKPGSKDPNNYNRTIACKNSALKKALETQYVDQVKFKGTYARNIGITQVPDHTTLEFTT